MTKVAARKTATLVGDDLAVNAEQVTGVSAKRELPVIWAVARGATVNKLVLIPAALLISAFIPWAIVPLLMLGGGFLCYEGAHKVQHKLFHKKAQQQEKQKLAEQEKAKQQGLQYVKLDGDVGVGDDGDSRRCRCARSVEASERSLGVRERPERRLRRGAVSGEQGGFGEFVGTHRLGVPVREG